MADRKATCRLARSTLTSLADGRLTRQDQARAYHSASGSAAATPATGSFTGACARDGDGCGSFR